MEGINRRNFIKGALGAGVITAVGAGLAGCGSNGGGAGSSKSKGNTEADILVVGTGLGGLSAGLKAAELGAKVIIIDKRPKSEYGGNSRIAGGSFATPLEDTDEARVAFYDDFMAKSEQRADTELTKMLSERIFDAFNWLKAEGVEFLDSQQTKPYRVMKATAAPGSFQGMPKVLEVLYNKFMDAGGTIEFETKLKDLIVDEASGDVVGVVAKTGSGMKTYKSKAVILATGGYCGNKQILEDYVDPNADGMMVRGHTWATGDGHIAAEKAGVMLRQMGGFEGIHIAAVSPTNVASGNPSTCLAYCVGINSLGKRFVDESRGYVVHGKAVAKQPGQTDALIIDQKIYDDVELARTQIANFERMGIPVVKAASLEELASQIQVPLAALSATLEEYNASTNGEATTGLAVPKTALAMKVETPPFYAFYPLRPGMTLSFGGLYINTKGEAMEADGTVVRGLYAAGECTGGFYIDDYIIGGALARTVTFGMIAAERAVEAL